MLNGLPLRRGVRGILALTGLLLLGALLAGCGSQGPGAAAEQFAAALNSRDFGAAYDLLSGDSPLRGVSRDDFIRNAENSFPRNAAVDSFQVTSEDVRDDTATVNWSAVEKIPGQPGRPVNSSWQMVRENGNWKIKQ